MFWKNSEFMLKYIRGDNDERTFKQQLYDLYDFLYQIHLKYYWINPL